MKTSDCIVSATEMLTIRSVEAVYALQLMMLLIYYANNDLPST